MATSCITAKIFLSTYNLSHIHYCQKLQMDGVFVQIWRFWPSRDSPPESRSKRMHHRLKDWVWRKRLGFPPWSIQICHFPSSPFLPLLCSLCEYTFQQYLVKAPKLLGTLLNHLETLLDPTGPVRGPTGPVRGPTGPYWNSHGQSRSVSDHYRMV